MGLFKKKKEQIDIFKTLDEVYETLTLANKYNLSAEVITWSFRYLKENPKLTIEEALQMGINEWIK
jgi:hypothetical protein